MRDVKRTLRGEGFINTSLGQHAAHVADVFGVGIRESGRMEAAEGCCGVVPLLLATEMICAFHMAINTLVVYNTGDSEIAGVKISAHAQIGNCTWALIGVPVIICGGVGALYRLEKLVRTYCYYMCVSLILGIFWTFEWILTGQACNTLVDPGMQRLGSSFTCGFAVAFLCFWLLWVLWFWSYLTYIVWSAAEEVRLSEYPDVAFFETMLRAQEAAAEAKPELGIMKPWRGEA